MPTINVLDGSGNPQTVNTLPGLGQVAKTGSLPVTLASDDDAQGKLGSLTETAPATDTASSGLNGRLQRIAQRLSSLIGLLPAALGPQAAAASLSVVPSVDQDPVFDHAAGTRTSVTASALVITTGAGHKFLRVSASVDVFLNTAGAAAVDDGTSILIVANQPEIVPVPPSTGIYALSSAGAAIVRCTPMKVR